MIWLMNGTSLSSSAPLGTVAASWEIDGTGDFNRNGQVDILWTDTATGERVIWLMNGNTFSSSVSLGVVATNCLARYVSDIAGGAEHLEVATRAATAQPGPGIAASVRENLPYGGWTRRAGRLQSCPLGSGMVTITLPDGPCRVMPFPTGDLEAAFQATGAPDVTAYSPVPDDPAARKTPTSDREPAGRQAYRSFGWARATGPDGTTQAWLQTGDSYVFTAAASIRAIEETFTRSPRGALSPATAFGTDFALTIPDTTRIDTIPAEAPPAVRL